MIIDCRLRPPTEEFVNFGFNRAFKELMVSARYEGKIYPVADFVKEMSAAGITLGVVAARDLETTFKYKISNEHVADLVRQFPQSFVGLAGVDPNKGMDAVRELDHAIRVLGLKGLSLDPFMHRHPANDKRYYPLYAKCVELDVAVMFTTGPAGFVPDAVMDHASPRVIDEVATDFPELRIMISHGGYPYVTEAIAVTWRHPNVYLDISGYEEFPGSEPYSQAANGLLRNKMLFASGHPYVTFTRALKVFNRLPIKPEVRENIYSKNAVAALKLDGLKS